MGVRLVSITQYRQIEKGCRVCDKPFTLKDPAFSVDVGRRSTINLYHVSCARQVNLTVAEIWWNRLAKYKRKEMLLQMDLELLDVEENYSLPYRLVSEEIKLLIDLRYYQK